MKQKILLGVSVLFVGFAAVLSGCGNSENVTEKSKDSLGSLNNDSSDSIQNLVDITVKFLNPGGNVRDGKRIIDAVNAISETRIGVHVNAEWIDIGSWNEQMNLAFAASEPIDIISISPTMNLNNMVQSNQLMDISELLGEYGEETLAYVDKLLPAVTYGDAVYGIPKLINMYSTYGITMNKDMLEEAGLMDLAESMDSWSDFKALLLAVKAAYPDVVPLFCSHQSLVSPAVPQYDLSSDKFSENKSIIQLGDPNYLIYLDQESETVHNIYEEEWYRKMLERVDEWYKEDLIYKDAPVTNEDYSTLLNNGSVFSYCSPGEGTAEERLANSQALVPDHELYYKVICEGQPTASNVTMFGYAVPFTSQEPEAAVKFLNLMYTNAEIQNLLAWGQEGVDYIVEDGVAKYPQGTESSAIGYHSQEFNYGNSYLTLPWDGKAADYNKNCMEYYENMEPIPYLGCAINTSQITTEIGACYNDILEFRPSLISGATEDVSETLAIFNQRLKEHGVDIILKTYQEQLEAWLKSE